MAVVYLADDLKHHRQVAIKVLKPELAASVGAERFLREIEIAAQLTHPHILPLHDSGEADGFLYYVMPYVDGESLRGRLTREGPLPIPDAVRILRDVADALAHAHAHGVVHRDIKPDNVMLSERHALVTDFGIGKAVSGAATPQTLTTAGVSLGTPAYMAPEQATADKNIDHRADIYALGVVGYEMLAGEAPIKGDNQQEVLAAQVLETPEPITRVRENLPRPLAQLLMRCLEKRREDRWQTAEEVLGRLEVLTTPSGGTTPTWARLTPVRTLRFKRITRWSARVGLGVAAVAAASVIGVLAVRGVGASGASLDPDLVAVAALENETADPSLDPLGRLAAEWITQGVQQRGVAAVVSTEAALAAAQASAGLTAADRVGAFAEATAAGVVLHGSYYVLGDSLQFQIQITDAAEGQLLSAMAPVTGPRTTASQGLGELRERTLAARLPRRRSGHADAAPQARGVSPVPPGTGRKQPLRDRGGARLLSRGVGNGLDLPTRAAGGGLDPPGPAPRHRRRLRASRCRCIPRAHERGGAAEAAVHPGDRCRAPAAHGAAVSGNHTLVGLLCGNGCLAGLST
jgi:serine/threonine-protein kinase